MGRKPSRNRLPPQMRARHRTSKRGTTTYYFLDKGGTPRREVSLGSDFVEAMRRWAELTQQPILIAPTFKDAADRYIVDILPGKGKRTQRDNLIELEFLLRIFNAPPVDLAKIKPVHLTKYIRWRMAVASEWYRAKGWQAPPNVGHVRANREMALFSGIFNYAREIGMTDAPNPAQGVRKQRETGRDAYVEDDMFAKVWEAADEPLRDAMDLAYLTGQRPADTLAFTEHDVRGGFLEVTQGKTKAKVRIEVIGELADVLARIRARKAQYKVVATALVVNEKGQPVLRDALRFRFDRARRTAGVPKAQFHFRDLRAKAGTDKTESAGDIRQAQKQLGHGSVTTTERYVRQRRGDKVGPTR